MNPVAMTLLACLSFGQTECKALRAGLTTEQCLGVVNAFKAAAPDPSVLKVIVPSLSPTRPVRRMYCKPEG